MINEQFTMFESAPPRAHIKGSDISTDGTTFTAGGTTWTPVHNSKELISCRGARVLSTAGGGGFLAVHLVDDPAGVWYLMDLNTSDTDPHGTGEPAEFDLIGDSTHGTTLTLDASLVIYPGLYKDGSSK
jgi:hypothetical protein